MTLLLRIKHIDLMMMMWMMWIIMVMRMMKLVIMIMMMITMQKLRVAMKRFDDTKMMMIRTKKTTI